MDIDKELELMDNMTDELEKLGFDCIGYFKSIKNIFNYQKKTMKVYYDKLQIQKEKIKELEEYKYMYECLCE